jgi:hypothetical protein
MIDNCGYASTKELYRTQKRYVEHLSEDGEWRDIAFAQLKKGMVFRMWDPDEEGKDLQHSPVENKKGGYLFLATSDVFSAPYGPLQSIVNTIEAEDYGW